MEKVEKFLDILLTKPENQTCNHKNDHDFLNWPKKIYPIWHYTKNTE